MLRSRLCLICATLFGPVSAHADIIYSTYGPTVTSAYANSSSHENASVFTITGADEITSISWDGAYLGNTLPADSFSVQIFGDAGGTPASAPEFLAPGDISRTDTDTTILGREIFHYVDTLSTPLDIGVGTYYLDPVDNPSSDAFYWALYNSVSGTTWTRDNPLLPAVGAWTANSGTPEFELDGVVAAPEPAFTLLTGLFCFSALSAIRTKQSPGLLPLHGGPEERTPTSQSR